MIKAIVTDIEGTTSSLSFVKDILFPYARKHIGSFVRNHAGDSQVQPLLKEVCAEAGEDLDTEGIIIQLQAWIDADKKITPLKSLQGLLWEAGYKQGDYKGHVYADARECMQHWHEQGIALYVYSSGSVYAQKLLFGHTDYGDLNPLFSGYFDTNIGAKQEAKSYRRIVEQTGFNAADILFLSDIEAELDAAREAGMQTCWLVREADVDTHASHVQVNDFRHISVA